MAKVIQNSFTGGMITESLYGRTDTEIYYKSAKTLNNFIVRPTGGIVSRPGFKDIVHIDSDDGINVPRVIPFVYSSTISYLVVFYEDSLTVYEEDGTQVYTYTIDYSNSSLANLKYKQYGNTLYIVDSTIEDINSPVFKLTYAGGDDWEWEEVSFTPEDVFSDLEATLSAEGTTGSTTRHYAISCFNSKTGDETLPLEKTITNSHSTLDNDNYVKFEFVIGNYTTFINDYDSLVLYRKEAGVYYFFGFLYTYELEDGVNGIYRDFGDSVSKLRVAPKEFDDFNETNGYPTSVDFYQQRSIWGGTPKERRKVWFSVLGREENLSYTYPVTPASGINLNLSYDIRNLAEVNKLLILTDLCEIKIDTSSGLSPYDIGISKQSYWGCSELSPLIIGSKVLFTGSAKTTVRDLTYEYTIDGYKGNDLSAFVPHFFYEQTIVDWCHQQHPYNCVWMVTSGGELFGLTYDSEQKVVAWHTHNTDGEFKNVCSIKSEGKDFLYVVVLRKGEYFLEKLGEDIFITGDVMKSHYLDGYRVYDGFNVSGSSNPVLTFSGKTGDGVTVTSASSFFTSGMVGQKIAVYDGISGSKTRIGLAEIASYVSVTEITVDFEVDIEGTGTYETGIGEWALQSNTLTGFTSLVGEEIQVVGDANYLGEETIDGSGDITLGDYYSYIVGGFPYESELETLDLNIGKSDILFNYKTIPIIYLKVEKTRQYKVGTFSNNLQYDYYDIASDNIYRVQKLNINPSWDRASNVSIKRDKPFALNINCLMLECEIGG